MNQSPVALAACRCESTGKLAFTSRDRARKASRRHPDHMSEYQCDDCGYWHIGHIAPDIIRGVVTRTDVYRPVSHARGDDLETEMDRLDELRAARELIITGRRRIRGLSRDQAVARVDAEIGRVVAVESVGLQAAEGHVEIMPSRAAPLRISRNSI